MIRRLAAITLWLLTGHAVGLAAFWGLLQVPESSIWTLALSALLVVALAGLALAVHAGAMTAWDDRVPVARGLLAGVRHAGGCLLAAALFGLIWWLTGALLDWHTRMAGQIDAAYIARAGRGNTAWIHTTIIWLVAVLRWSVGLTISITLLGTMVAGGIRHATTVTWLKAATEPRRWLTITACFALLVALPWAAVDWRPAKVSLGLEPWFVAAKLALIATLAAAGWALALRAGRVDPPQA